MLKQTLGLLALLLFASPLAADVIYFADGDNVTADQRKNVVNETMRRLTYQSVESKTNEYKDIWEFTGYNLSRVRSEAVFEDSWNAALRAGRESKWNTLPGLVDKALATEPQNRYDRDSAKLRLLYYKLRALAVSDPDDSFESTWDEYVADNIAYAKRDDNLEKNFTKAKMENGPFKNENLVALHATTADALSARGMYYNAKAEYEKAYTDGYSLVAEVGASLGRTLSNENYVTRYAVQAMQDAADLFAAAAEADTDNAITYWEKATEVYERTEDLHRSVRNLVLQDAARIDGAICLIAIADIHANNDNRNDMQKFLGDARRVLERQVRDFEEAAKRPEAPDKDWLTGEKATALAAAYNGLGYANKVEGKLSLSLASYSRTIALFSSDSEKRAQALLQAGEVCVELGMKALKSRYYLDTAKLYHQELANTLSETKAAKQAGALEESIKTLEAARAK